MFCAGSTFAQELQWLKKLKSIVLLQSTNQDVIKLFGEPEKTDYPYFRVFTLKEGELTVQYSTGFCTEQKRRGWNVPALIVTEVLFVPKKKIKPEKLGYDLTIFDFASIYDVPGASVGRNDELGIRFVKTSKGKVESITFFPPTKFDNLYCEE